MKRPAVFSRRLVDPVNSVAWYAMDGLWLAQWAWPAYVATAVTLATGGVLVVFSWKRRRQLSDDLALNAWMWMNACWVISDLGEMPALWYFAAAAGVLGAVLLAISIRPSKGLWGVPQGFRKMRIHGR